MTVPEIRSRLSEIVGLDNIVAELDYNDKSTYKVWLRWEGISSIIDDIYSDIGIVPEAIEKPCYWWGVLMQPHVCKVYYSLSVYINR